MSSESEFLKVLDQIARLPRILSGVLLLAAVTGLCHLLTEKLAKPILSLVTILCISVTTVAVFGVWILRRYYSSRIASLEAERLQLLRAVNEPSRPGWLDE